MAEAARAHEPTDGNLVIDEGADSTRLIVVFTGDGGGLSMHPYDFWDLTGTLRHSRILLRDPSRRWYQHGISDEVRSFPDIVELLSREIRARGPERVTIIGNSMGGFAALVAGHLLEVDEVHAFAPQASIHPLWVFRRVDRLIARRGVAMLAVAARNPRRWELLDAARVLRRHNGTTRYYLHVCEGSPDARRARRLSGQPGVTTLTYPGTSHNVILEMAKTGYLKQVLRLEPPDTPEDLHNRIYRRTPELVEGS